MGVVDIMNLLPDKGGFLTFLMGQLPGLFRYDGFVLPFIDGKIALNHHVHLVAGADFLLRAPAAIRDLAHVDWVIQHIHHKRRRESGHHAILAGDLLIAVCVQVFGDCPRAAIGMDILVKDDPDIVIRKYLSAALIVFSSPAGSSALCSTHIQRRHMNDLPAAHDVSL